MSHSGSSVAKVVLSSTPAVGTLCYSVGVRDTPARAPWTLEETPLALAAAQAGERLRYDLTGSNPTDVGLALDWEPVRQALADPAARRYAPDARGLAIAREGVASYYGEHGADVQADDVLLTASTSEAYAWLFKLLCDPGEAVAVPAPSYPLFDFLTALEAVKPVRYALYRDERWQIDLESVERVLAQGARAVVVVQPHNPVGAVLSGGEREALVSACAAHDAALIVDEVFLDYGSEVRTLAGERGCTTFVLSGLSKVAALPQLKCAWIVGDPTGALWPRLEIVADTFLSVATPVQLALPSLIANRSVRQDVVRARLSENRATLSAQRGPRASWDIVGDEAGWSAVLRVPAVRSAEAWALELLDTDATLVHPGELYDLPPHHLVLSLLGPPDRFRAGVDRLARRLG